MHTRRAGHVVARPLNCGVRRRDQTHRTDRRSCTTSCLGVSVLVGLEVSSCIRASRGGVNNGGSGERYRGNSFICHRRQNRSSRARLRKGALVRDAAASAPAILVLLRSHRHAGSQVQLGISVNASMNDLSSLCQAPNKQMQRARTDHKCVLGWHQRRVADLRRYAALSQ